MFIDGPHSDGVHQHSVLLKGKKGKQSRTDVYAYHPYLLLRTKLNCEGRS